MFPYVGCEAPPDVPGATPVWQPYSPVATYVCDASQNLKTYPNANNDATCAAPAYGTSGAWTHTMKCYGTTNGSLLKNNPVLSYTYRT